MRERAVTQAQPAQALSVKPESALHRKCARGTHTIAGGECEACEKKGLAGERRMANRPEPFSTPRDTPAQSSALASGTQAQSSFAHDFSRVRTQTRSPKASLRTAAAFRASAGQEERGGASGNLFLKERIGGASVTSADPRALRTQLGSGRPFGGQVRNRMESAFGQDFSHVRVHDNSTAAALSTGLNARAFTVGQDVAFGAGEYQPDTLLGDALIAHELAHVIQQGGAHAAVAPLEKGGGQQEALEQEADRSATSVVTSLWGRAKGVMRERAENAMPRLRSGLRLSRCGSDRPEATERPATPAPRPSQAPSAPTPASSEEPAQSPAPACVMGSAADLSARGSEFIRSWERLRLTPYDDLPGNPTRTSCTVGWGHKLHRGFCTAEERARPITSDEAERLYSADVATAASTVHTRFGTVCLPQNQIDAIISLAFNAGRAAIIGTSPTNRMHRFSALIHDSRRTPAERARLAAAEIRAYGGDDNRRNAEATIFETGTYRNHQ
jgi:GH24 family phage-related lysozyme (muramidase)